MNRFLSVVSLLVIFLTQLSYADMNWPSSHPGNAIFQHMPYYSGGYDAYFWWERGYLWMEVQPDKERTYISTGQGQYTYQQPDGKPSGLTNVPIRFNTQASTFFQGIVYAPMILKVSADVDQGYRQGPQTNLDTLVYYKNDYSTIAIKIPKTSEQPPQSHPIHLKVGEGGEVIFKLESEGWSEQVCNSECTYNVKSNDRFSVSESPYANFRYVGRIGTCGSPVTTECQMNFYFQNISPKWPVKHSVDSIYQRIKTTQSEEYDAFFWWQDNNLWMEVIPISKSPDLWNPDFIQNDKQTKVRYITSEGMFFSGPVYKSSHPSVIFKLTTDNGWPSKESEIILYYYSGNIEVKIPKNNDVVLPEYYLLSVGKTGLGKVKSNPFGVDCGAVCSAKFEKGTTVTLIASPDDGQVFGGWSGGCSGNNSCSVIMDGSRNVSALFASAPPYMHTLTILTNGNGRVISATNNLDCKGACSISLLEKSILTLFAKPNVNAKFLGWSGACLGVEACTITMDIAKTVTANFASALPQKNLSIARIGEGIITDSAGKIVCGNVCNSTYDKGEKIILAAAPSEGWRFKGWAGACIGRKPCNVKLNGNRKVKASFIRIR